MKEIFVWLTLIVIFLGAVLVLHSTSGVHRNKKQRLKIACLRMAGLIALIVLLYDPSTMKESQVLTKDKLIILYDDSGSMKASGRVERARQFVDSSRLVSRIPDVEILSFGSLKSSVPSEALSAIVNENSDNVGGVLLFSDLVRTESVRIEAAARKLGQHSIPIFPVSQNISPQRDAGLLWVSVPKVVFNGEPIGLSVHVKLENMTGLTVPLRIFLNDQEVERRDVYASQAIFVADYQFQIHDGEGDVRIELGVPQSDVVDGNNNWQGTVTRDSRARKILMVGDQNSQDLQQFTKMFGNGYSAVELTFLDIRSNGALNWKDYDAIVLFAPKLSESEWRSLRGEVRKGKNLVIVSDRNAKINSLSRDAFVPVRSGGERVQPFTLDVKNSLLNYEGDIPTFHWRRNAFLTQADSQEEVRIVTLTSQKELANAHSAEESLNIIAARNRNLTDQGIIFSRREELGRVFNVLTDELWRLATIDEGQLYRDMWWSFFGASNERVRVSSWKEWSSLETDLLLQERLASLSYGKLLDEKDLEQLPEILASRSRVVTRETRYSIWNSWGALIMVCAVFFAEWYLRKKERLS